MGNDKNGRSIPNNSKSEIINQYQIKKMIDVLFDELVTINKEREANGQKGVVYHPSDLFLNPKIQSMTRHFDDPEVIQHYLSRIWNMMNSYDALDSTKQK